MAPRPAMAEARDSGFTAPHKSTNAPDAAQEAGIFMKTYGFRHLPDACRCGGMPVVYQPAHTDSDRPVTEQEQTLTQGALDSIMKMIRTGELAHGDIVSERSLAEKLGLSRTPVREAISRLEGQNFVRRSGRSLLVNGVALSDLFEVLGVRRVLEAEAARIAATRMTAPESARIRGLLMEMTEGQVTAEHHWDVDEVLHMGIAAATGNRLMERMIHDCRVRTRMFGMERIPGRFDIGRAEHLAILDAIEARDPAAAALRMSEHIDNARAAIVRSLTGEDRP
ncbi:FCD domain-containing protein [Frigidibacter sp. MR17.14]|uniref:GntR family transcriptional regulator n=1 Tax=Frigidibacter sp. MR17.14 TaxID=3126509 RepID=UPI0030131C7E